MRVVGFTGHRPGGLAAAAHGWLSEVELPRVADRLAGQTGCEVGISGMALGADLWWAQAVADSPMDLWAYVPFDGHDRRWCAPDREVLAGLVATADVRVTVADRRLGARAYHMRNDRIVADCDVLVAVVDPAATCGGAVSTLRKARRAGRPVVWVDPVRRATRRVGVDGG